MNEEEVMKNWYISQGIVATDENLVEILSILKRNGVTSFALQGFANGSWGVSKMF